MNHRSRPSLSSVRTIRLSRAGTQVPAQWIDSISDHEFLEVVLRLFPGCVVSLEPRPHLLPQLRLAIAAQAFTGLARLLHDREMAVVGFEDVLVLAKDRADVRVRSEPALLLDGRSSSREGIHHLLSGLSFGVGREDARLRDRGRHLATGAQEAGEELVMDQGRLRVPELGSDVARDAKVGILVDAARNQHGHLFPRLDGREERRGGLNARVENLANVVRVLEPEDRLGRRVRNAFRDLDRDRIEVVDVLRVQEDARELRVEAHRDDVEDVVVAHLRRVLEVVEVLEEELLVVRDLEVQLRLKLLLDPFREEPGEHVPDVDAARGSAARVQRERGPFLIPVQDPIQVAVAVEHPAPEHRMQFARDLLDPFQDLGGNPLRAELDHEPVVVHGPPDFPRGDDEVIRHFDRVFRRKDKDSRVLTRPLPRETRGTAGTARRRRQPRSSPRRRAIRGVPHPSRGARGRTTCPPPRPVGPGPPCPCPPARRSFDSWAIRGTEWASSGTDSRTRSRTESRRTRIRPPRPRARVGTERTDPSTACEPRPTRRFRGRRPRRCTPSRRTGGRGRIHSWSTGQTIIAWRPRMSASVCPSRSMTWATTPSNKSTVASSNNVPSGASRVSVASPSE